MNTKEYLRQAVNLKRLIERQQARIQTLDSLAESAGHPFDSAGSGHRDPTKGSKVENLALELAELRDIEAQNSARHARMLINITVAIHAVNNLTYEHILSARYLDGKNFDQIADEMGLSKDYIFRLHREALKLVRITDNANSMQKPVNNSK